MKDLLRILRSLRDRERGIQPDPAWVRATRATLLMQVRNTMPSPEVVARHRAPLIVSFYRQMVEAVRGPVLATLSIAGVVLGGSVASVSAAEQALPGDALYSVKLVTEQARLALAGTSHDKLVLKSSFTIRRVEELRAIIIADVSEKEERAALVADVLKRDLDTLKQQLTEVQKSSTNAETAQAAKTVDKNAVEVVKALAGATANLSPTVKEKVAAAQAQAADVGITAIEVLVDARQGAGDDAISSSEINSSLSVHAEMAAETVATTKALAELNASSTVALLPTTSSSTLQLAKDAESSLAAMKELAGEQVLDETLDQAVTLLKDATTKTFIAQKQVVLETSVIANASSTSSMLETATSSTTSGSTTSTPSGVDTSSSTQMNTSTTP